MGFDDEPSDLLADRRPQASIVDPKLVTKHRTTRDRTMTNYGGLLATLCIVPLVACGTGGAEAASAGISSPSPVAPGHSAPGTPCGALRITARSDGHAAVLTAGHPAVLTVTVGSVITMAATKPTCRNLIQYYAMTSTALSDRTILRDTGPNTFVVSKPATVTITATDAPSEQRAGERLNMTLGHVTVVARR